MEIPILGREDLIQKQMQHNYAAQKTYLAMYSSWWQGITTDPNCMMVPIDDHLVHRGDGVFEAIKSVDRCVYLLDAHVQRLMTSAEALAIKSPYSAEEMKSLILACFRAAKADHAMARVYLSRGPGLFSTNPYDSIGAQVYIVITTFNPLPAQKYQQGVTLGLSRVPVKSSWLAQVKSCNYLPNVMMKKESVDRNLDFTISVDDQGFIAESSTENLIWIDAQGTLTHPRLDNILKGTTMTRLFDLVHSRNLLPTSRQGQSRVQELLTAQAVFMVGTTLDVLPVKQFEQTVFQSSIWSEKLNELIRQDQRSGSPAVTEY